MAVACTLLFGHHRGMVIDFPWNHFPSSFPITAVYFGLQGFTHTLLLKQFLVLQKWCSRATFALKLTEDFHTVFLSLNSILTNTKENLGGGRGRWLISCDPKWTFLYCLMLQYFGCSKMFWVEMQGEYEHSLKLVSPENCSSHILVVLKMEDCSEN